MLWKRLSFMVVTIYFSIIFLFLLILKRKLTSMMIESRKHKTPPSKTKSDPIILHDEESLGVILEPEEMVPRFLTEEERKDLGLVKKTQSRKKSSTPKKKRSTLPRKPLPQVLSPPTPSSNINLNCLLSEEDREKEHTFSFSLKHLNTLEHKKKMLETPENRSKFSFRDKVLCKNDFILKRFSNDFSIDYSDVLKKIAAVLRRLSRLSYNEIEKGLYKPEDFDLSFTKDIEGIIAIIGVDPAPLTCGLCLYSFVDGFIEVSIHAFRQKSHAPDLGCVDLCDVVRKFIKIIDCPCIMWGIENQMAALKKKNNILSNPSLSDLKKESYYLEQYAIQFFITALIPRERLCIISPSALKTFFGFDEKQNDPNDQYGFNKEMAVKIGKSCVSDYIKKRIIELTGAEDPNIYDAILITRYIYETIVGIPSFSKKKKQEEKKEKRKRRKIDDEGSTMKIN